MQSDSGEMTNRREIQHISLQTGDARRLLRSEVSDGDAADCGAWMVRAIHAAEPLPMPAPLSEFAGKALRLQGGAVVTVYSHQPHIGQRLPLLTFTVAVQSPLAYVLWNAALQNAERTAERIPRPPAPWCAVNLLQGSEAGIDALEWFADFVAGCAWAWVTRNTILRPVT